MGHRHYRKRLPARRSGRKTRSVRSYWVELGLIAVAIAIVSPSFLRSIVKRLPTTESPFEPIEVRQADETRFSVGPVFR